MPTGVWKGVSYYLYVKIGSKWVELSNSLPEGSPSYGISWSQLDVTVGGDCWSHTKV